MGLINLEQVTGMMTAVRTFVDEKKVNKTINVLWKELVNMCDTNKLFPGQTYRITDYVTTTNQDGTVSAGNQFDIIVTATSENTLSEDAKAIQHEGDTYFNTSDLNAWEIKYCLDNDTYRFIWADNSDNGRGVIYYMKDEYNNECPYDFKNIQFSYSGYNCYTFSYLNDEDIILDTSIAGNDGTLLSDEGLVSGVYGNVIKPCDAGPRFPDWEMTSEVFALNNIVFLSDYTYDSFYYGCNNNTFGYNCYGNYFGNNCYNNIFGDGCSSNTFGNDCDRITFGNNCYNNIFGDGCYNNIFGNGCYNNIFGNGCYNNIFGNYCHDNSFGNYCHDNSFGNNCSNIKIKNHFYNNTFGNDCTYIRFTNSSDVSYESLWISYCGHNKFDDNCTRINIYNGETASSGNLLRNIHVQASISNGAYKIAKVKRNMPYIIDVYDSVNLYSTELTIGDIYKIDWADLVELRNNGKLVPGKKYRIIDYVTTTTQANTQSAFHQFDIIVTATSENTLSEDAKAIQHEGDNYFSNSDLNAWEIKYCLDNDTDRFLWTGDKYSYSINVINTNSETSFTVNFNNTIDSITYGSKEYVLNVGERTQILTGPYVYVTLSSSKRSLLIEDQNGRLTTPNDSYGSINVNFSNCCKGVIYYMKDEYENECGYDFKNIQFIRKLNSSGKYDETNGANKWCYTFGGLSDRTILSEYRPGVFTKNIIKSYYNTSTMAPNVIQHVYALSNNVFLLGNAESYMTSNTFGYNCYNNTFGYDCRNNYFGNSCYNNIFNYGCYNNSFGDNCYDNSFNYNCHDNSFGDNCYDNEFGNYCHNNSFGNKCYENTIGSSCFNNSFGDNCYDNEFGAECNGNSFGNSCAGNTVGSSCDRNSFGNYCYNNTFGDYCSYNTVGNYCYNNLLESQWSENNTIEDNCEYVMITTTSTVSSGQNIKNYVIKSGTKFSSSILTTEVVYAVVNLSKPAFVTKGLISTVSGPVSYCFIDYGPSFKNVISSCTLDHTYKDIHISNNASFAITLPSKPWVGVEFNIMKSSNTDKTITLNGAGKNILSITSGSSGSTCNLVSRGTTKIIWSPYDNKWIAAFAG